MDISCFTKITADSHARVSAYQNWILDNVNGSDIGFVTFKSDGEDKDSSFLCYGEETGKSKNKVLYESMKWQWMIIWQHLLKVRSVYFYIGLEKLENKLENQTS